MDELPEWCPETVNDGKHRVVDVRPPKEGEHYWTGMVVRRTDEDLPTHIVRLIVEESVAERLRKLADNPCSHNLSKEEKEMLYEAADRLEG